MLKRQSQTVQKALAGRMEMFQLSGRKGLQIILIFCTLWSVSMTASVHNEFGGYIFCEKSSDCPEPEDRFYCHADFVRWCQPCGGLCTGAQQLIPNCKQFCPSGICLLLIFAHKLPMTQIREHFISRNFHVLQQMVVIVCLVLHFC